MPTVTSNYNFVPAPKEREVFTPYWAEQVSHDIPFSDGECGEIKITLTAETPIFIRNGHIKDNDENEFSFYEKNGEKIYFIPGSSIKGMVRNVLEIMSSSRIKVKDDIYSYRNLKDQPFKDQVMHNNQLKTGWLTKLGGNWFIDECDMKRIDLRRRIRGNYADLSAADKYRQYGSNPIQNFKFSNKVTNRYGDDTEIYLPNPIGKFRGKVVFFGGMNNKKYEYIFSTTTSNRYDVDPLLIKKFEAIDEKLKDTQWQYFKEQNLQQIPVFFYSDNKVEVDHFGFGKLYKISNTKFLRETTPLKSYYSVEKYQADLAETIFGNVEDKDKKRGENRNKISLKGRVICGNAKTTDIVDEKKISEVTVILASPKASYYPFYLNDANYYSKEPEINGFKRYPVHTYPKTSVLNPDNQDIQSVIKPLPQQTKFTSVIRFHNLRKVEVGALLSALTFHGNEADLHHSIGSGKPLGYGRVSLVVDHIKMMRINEERKHTYEDVSDERTDFISAFEVAMDKNNGNNGEKWINNDEIVQLFAMAADPTKEHLLRYPTLENPNEFVDFSLEGLPTYSHINGRFNAMSIVEKEQKIIEEKELVAKALEKEKIQKEKETKRLEMEAEMQKKAAENKLKKEQLQASAKDKNLDFSEKNFKGIQRILNKHYKDHYLYNTDQKLLVGHQKTNLLIALDSEKIKKELLQKINKPENKFPWSDLGIWIGKQEMSDFRKTLKNLLN